MWSSWIWDLVKRPLEQVRCPLAVPLFYSRGSEAPLYRDRHRLPTALGVFPWLVSANVGDDGQLCHGQGRRACVGTWDSDVGRQDLVVLVPRVLFLHS